MTDMIRCEDRLPEKAGMYKVKNNTCVNDGIGFVRFSTEKNEWAVSQSIRDFYKVLGWYESEEDIPNHVK